MTVPAAPRARWLDFIPAISLAVVLAGIVWAGGGYIGQLKENLCCIDHLGVVVLAPPAKNCS
ncbi:hypothetical protein [Sphingomonas sp. PB4P5]|uniref:hypothetical protein n=1 Tax=Parasphingomonas puruogangriensis TaxID=3096155 RepID=UPI002FCAD1C5